LINLNKKLKIFFVSNTAFFIHNFFPGLIRTLKDNGNEVVIVSPEDEFSEKLKNDGFKFIPVGSLNRKGSNPVEDFNLFSELYKIFKDGKPDLVLLYTIKINVYGGMAAKLAGVKFVCTVTGLGWLFTEKSLKTVIGGLGYKILYKIAFAFAEKVIFQNEDDREFFLKNWLVDRGKTILTPGVGVDTDRFSPKACEGVELNSQKTVFLLVARMLWDKGIGEFVEAAKIVKERYPFIEFCLLGPLDYENRSAIPENIIKGWENEGVIKYLGKTTDVRPFICQSDVVVLPSYREAIGKSLLEAMAMGKPVITTDTAGCKETVDDGKNGFLVPVKDSKSLADAMIKFIQFPSEEKRKMGEYSREKAVRGFDENIIIDLYNKVIKNTFDKKVV